MPANKDFERKCQICKRSNFNGRMLGPLIHTNSISAHYNCVLYSPVTPKAECVASCPEDEAIAGVSTRFIRNEGRRAQRLVIKKQTHNSNYYSFMSPLRLSSSQTCNYCKASGANVGCCYDVGNDAVLKFCSKKYHIDCGLDGGVSFTVTSNRGTVSLCFEHRDTIERSEKIY